ncbi:MAG: hypothetical protein ACH6QP_00510 [Candidatus Carsonella ruddii]
MKFIEIRLKQNNIITNNEKKNKIKKSFYLFFLIKINLNIEIKNFKQILFKKKNKKKIFFFPKHYFLDKIFIKKNFLILLTNIYI